MDFLERSRHGTVYHFRRRVPKDLVAPLGRSQIVVSTHTEVRAIALRRARVLLSRPRSVRLHHPIPQGVDVALALNRHAAMEPG